MRIWIFLLVMSVSVSAMGVVYLRHAHRLSYIDFQNAQQHRDDLNTEWRQLLLEQSTWSFHHRVETEARKRLNMIVPDSSAIVVVRVP